MSAKSYRYEAFDPETADMRLGVIEASNAAMARRSLVEAGLAVMSLDQVRLESGLQSKLAMLTRRRSQFKPGVLSWIAFQLAQMEQAGLSYQRALSLLAQRRKGTDVGRTLAKLSERIGSGEVGLAEGFGEQGERFGEVFLAFLAAGEQGDMGAQLRRLKETFARQDQTRRMVKSALSYPKTVMVIAIGIILGILLFIIPSFRTFYAEFNSSLPASTRVLIAMANWLAANIVIAPVVILIIWLVWRWARKQPAVRLKIDTAKVVMPGPAGEFFRLDAMTRVSDTLAGLIDAGVGMGESLEITARAAGNARYRRGLQEAASLLHSQISDLAEALRATQVFSDEFIAVLEAHGESDTLGQIQSYRSMVISQLDDMTSRLKSVLEPFMVVAVGGVVGTMIILTYLPIFDLVKVIH